MYMKKDKNVENSAKIQQEKKKRIIGRPFVKGQSGNPAGKPKGTISITQEIKRKLAEIPPNERKTYLQILITKILKKALLDEEEPMIKLIWNYIDGLPTQTVIGEGLQPIIQLICTGKEKDLKFPEVKE